MSSSRTARKTSARGWRKRATISAGTFTSTSGRTSGHRVPALAQWACLRDRHDDREAGHDERRACVHGAGLGSGEGRGEEERGVRRRVGATGGTIW